MKGKCIFGRRDFLAYFKKVKDRFDIQERGVFLATDKEDHQLPLTKAEDRALREYPHISYETPVLAFPFSYSAAEQLANSFDLWDEADMEGLLCATGELLTLDQVAEVLKTNPYGVWALMQPQNDPINHDPLPVLQPSIFFDNVYLHWRDEDGREMGGDLHGLFELFNSRGLQADSRGVVKITFLERAGVFYAADPERKKLIVNVSRVYVTRKNLNNYLQAIGKRPSREKGAENEVTRAERVKQPGTAGLSADLEVFDSSPVGARDYHCDQTPNAGSQQLDLKINKLNKPNLKQLEEMCREMQDAEMDKDSIVEILLKKKPEITGKRIGLWLYPNDYSANPSARDRQGQRLVKKAKKRISSDSK